MGVHRLKDIMLDLETLGLTPGHIVLSIGAQAFDRVTGDLGDTFNVCLDVEEQVHAGLKTDPQTLEWWQTKSFEAWQNSTKSAKPVKATLKEFRLWYKFQGATAIWANGAGFDMPMLEAIYHAFDERVPWHYRHPRDTRTVFDLVGRKMGDYGTENALVHDALADAIFQAKETVKAIKELLG